MPDMRCTLHGGTAVVDARLARVNRLKVTDGGSC